MNYVLKLVRNVFLLKWVKQEQINLNIPTMIIVLNWFFRFIKAITGYGVVRRAFYFCVVSLKLQMKWCQILNYELTEICQ